MARACFACWDLFMGCEKHSASLSCTSSHVATRTCIFESPLCPSTIAPVLLLALRLTLRAPPRDSGAGAWLP